MGLFRTKKALAPAIVINNWFGDPQAQRIEAAFAARDWTTARGILTGAATSEHFARYIVIAADAEGLEEWIAGPIRDEPGSALPLLLRGARYVYWAWEARGSGLANTVGQNAWKTWFKRLKVAEDSLDEALEKDPTCVEAWHWLIVLGRARQVSKEERWRRFDGLTALDPTHYYGHAQMLEALMPKWSGSSEEMFAFARSRAQGAPGTGLPVLVASAHLEQRFVEGGSARAYTRRPEVAEEIVQAAYQSIWHPSYQRSALTPLLLNEFAYAFSYADRYVEAERLFQEIGDDGVTPSPWQYERMPADELFLSLRGYVRESLSEEEAG
jgi:hypothetical protein